MTASPAYVFAVSDAADEPDEEPDEEPEDEPDDEPEDVVPDALLLVVTGLVWAATTSVELREVL
jgi:hypothetical protein